MLKIWTDGSCLGNPGPGGWGFVATDGTHTAERSGGERNTTNNRMELMAVICALTGRADTTNWKSTPTASMSKTACNHGCPAGKRIIGAHPQKNRSRTKTCGKNWMNWHRPRKSIGSGYAATTAMK